jgi:hypothetical protein
MRPIFLALICAACAPATSTTTVTAAELDRAHQESAYLIAAAQCDSRETCPGTHSPRDQCIASRIDETTRITGMARCAALLEQRVTRCVESVRAHSCDVSLERINACKADVLCGDRPEEGTN